MKMPFNRAMEMFLKPNFKYFLSRSFKKWKKLNTAEHWLKIIRERTGSCFPDYNCKIEMIEI